MKDFFVLSIKKVLKVEFHFWNNRKSNNQSNQKAIQDCSSPKLKSIRNSTKSVAMDMREIQTTHIVQNTQFRTNSSNFSLTYIFRTGKTCTFTWAMPNECHLVGHITQILKKTTVFGCPRSGSRSIFDYVYFLCFCLQSHILG